MRNTIKPKYEYRVFKAHDKKTGEELRVVKDGSRILFIAEPRSIEDYKSEKEGNECFHFCEVFTSAKGVQYIYWRDEEIDADYLTKVTA